MTYCYAFTRQRNSPVGATILADLLWYPCSCSRSRAHFLFLFVVRALARDVCAFIWQISRFRHSICYDFGLQLATFISPGLLVGWVSAAFRYHTTLTANHTMEFPGLDLSSHEGVTLNDMWTSHEELHDDNLPALDEDAEETFDVRKAGLNKLSKIRYMQMLEMMSEGLRELATRVAAEMEFTPEQCMFSILSLYQKKQKRSRTQSEWNAWVSLTWQEECETSLL